MVVVGKHFTCLLIVVEWLISKHLTAKKQKCCSPSNVNQGIGDDLMLELLLLNGKHVHAHKPDCVKTPGSLTLGQQAADRLELCLLN